MVVVFVFQPSSQHVCGLFIHSSSVQQRANLCLILLRCDEESRFAMHIVAYSQFARCYIGQRINKVSWRRKEVIGVGNGVLILHITCQRPAFAYEYDGRIILQRQCRQGVCALNHEFAHGESQSAKSVHLIKLGVIVGPLFINGC